MTRDEVLEEWWALVARHLPLRYGRDRVYVSKDAYDSIRDPDYYRMVLDADLRGVEMRLQSECGR